MVQYEDACGNQKGSKKEVGKEVPGERAKVESIWDMFMINIYCRNARVTSVLCTDSRGIPVNDRRAILAPTTQAEPNDPMVPY